MSRKKLLVADLLCGAGGSSTGCRQALTALGLEMELVCVNHWGVAIETHRRNHPEARHYCQDIASVRPHIVVLSGYPSPLYGDALKGWRRVERMAYADGARKRQEVLWINPRAAAALNAQLPFDAAEVAV